MPFAAFDLHKKMVEAILLSDSGSVELRLRFPTTRTELLKFAKKHLTKNHVLAVEAYLQHLAGGGVNNSLCQRSCY